MLLDGLFIESLQAYNKMLTDLPKYKRDSCKECNYKIICVGECEKTIKN